MSRTLGRIVVRRGVYAAAVFVFGSLACVQNLADVVGTGLTLTAASGALGPATRPTTALGAGLDLFSDLFRFAALGG